MLRNVPTTDCSEASHPVSSEVAVEAQSEVAAWLGPEPFPSALFVSAGQSLEAQVEEAESAAVVASRLVHLDLECREGEPRRYPEVADLSEVHRVVRSPSAEVHPRTSKPFAPHPMVAEA